jgi:hypothetical protein
MFNSYEMTRAFVSERQGTLRHEARQNRLARGRRQARQAERTTRTHQAPRLAALLHPRLVGASLSEPLLP